MNNPSGLSHTLESVAQASQNPSWNGPVNAQTSPSVISTAPPRRGDPSIVTYYNPHSGGVEMRKVPAHNSDVSVSYQPITRYECWTPLGHADELSGHGASQASSTNEPTISGFHLETHQPDPSNWAVSTPWSDAPQTLTDSTVRALATNWSSLGDASYDQLGATLHSTHAKYSVRKLAQLLSAAVLSTNHFYTDVWQSRKQWSRHQQNLYGTARTKRLFFGEETVTADSPVCGYRHEDLPEEYRTNRAEVNGAVEFWMACIAVNPSFAWFKFKGGGTVMSPVQGSILAATSARMTTVDM